MTKEELLTADLEALKIIVACLVKLSPNASTIAATANDVLTRHETTLLYTTKQMTDAQIHRMRETMTRFLT